MSGYNAIKKIYEDILCDEEYNKAIDENFPLNKDSILSDYVKNIYDTLTSEKYSDEFLHALNLIELSRSKFHELMLEVICLNLYENTTLILQQLDGKGIHHKHYLVSFISPEMLKQKSHDYFSRRIQYDRTLGKQKIGKSEEIFNLPVYIPNLIRAYKDVFFIPRRDVKKNILDISPYYIDIFSALIYGNESKDKADINLIKSYQLWKFKKSTILQVEKIYNIININTEREKSNSKISELLFMERLFGFINLSQILRKDCTDSNDYLNFTEAISSIECLGYSNLHKIIIEKINSQNVDEYSNIIKYYIYPLCAECVKMCVNKLIRYTSRLKNEKRIDFIKKIRRMCFKFIKNSPLVTGIFVYNMSEMVERIKKYKIKKLDDNFDIQLVKMLKYQYSNKNSESELQQHMNFCRCMDSGDYADDINDDYIFFDLKFSDLLFKTNIVEVDMDFILNDFEYPDSYEGDLNEKKVYLPFDKNTKRYIY